jgi:diacylglycerol kinase (ATP)
MKRLVRALLNSLSGLRYAFIDEAAFREELMLCIALVPIACLYAPDSVALALMLMSIFIVIIVELLNTAIEDTVDRISLKLHPLAKKAKDIASAAVLLAIINLIVVWTVILIKN